MPKMDIAIIGLAGRFPGAVNIEEFWQNLCQGKEGVTFFSDAELLQAGVKPELLANPRYVKAAAILNGVDLFDAEFFKFSPREAEALDPQQRMLLECAWEALEDGGYSPLSYPGAVGVFVGSGGVVTSYLLEYLQHHPEVAGASASFQHLANDKDFLASRVAYKLNLRGPSLSIQTACSTSLVTVHMACQSLQAGECDMALAGGSNVRVPVMAGYLRQEGDIFSPDGHCRPFDANAEGTFFGSGVGLVLLKPLAKALQDGDEIYAVIKGSAINNDGGSKLSYTAASFAGQVDCVRRAIENSNCDPATISLVEAHGTATKMGDPVEVSALSAVFQQFTEAKQYCAIGSVKSNLSHLEAASGIAGLIKTVLALYHRKIPPSINFNSPNPKIQFEQSPFYVNTTLQEWPETNVSRRAAINSLGIGGTNAFMVLEQASSPETKPKLSPGSWHIVTLSAKTSATLEQQKRNLLDFIRNNPNVSLGDVAYTANVRRSHFNYRMAVCARSLSDLIEKLQNHTYLQNDIFPESEPTINPSSTDLADELSANCLAEQYVAGAKVGWDKLYPRSDYTKVNLPTYAFQRKRHWVGKASLHPLLGCAGTRTADEVCFENTVVLNGELAYLRDHVVSDSIVFPAAAAVELFHAAGKTLFNSNQFQLHNLVIETPLLLSETLPVIIQTRANKIGAVNIYEVSLYSLVTSDKQDQQWQKHASVQLQSIDTEQCNLKVFNYAEIKAVCATAQSKTDFYARLSDLGLNYGRAFQTVKEAWLGNHQALEELETVAGKPYQVHPTLLDGCLQLIAVLYNENNPQDKSLLLPVGIENILYYEGIDDPTYSYVNIVENQSDQLVADIKIISGDNTVLVEVQGVRVRKTSLTVWNKLGHSKKSTSSKFSYQKIWTETPVTLERNSLSGNWILMSDSGAAVNTQLIEAVQLHGAVVTENTSIDSLQGSLQGIILLNKFKNTENLDWQKEQQASITLLLKVLQTIVNHLSGKKPLICVVTVGAQSINKEYLVNVFDSPLLGLLRTAALEYPQQKFISVDLDPANSIETQIQCITNELAVAGNDLEVVYRQQQRYTCKLEAYDKIIQQPQFLTIPNAESYHLNLSRKGALENLVLQPQQWPVALESHQVALEVRAVGLNFRDVLNALDLYPGDPGPLGGDMAGVITAVGDQVSNYKVGDAVFGFAQGCLASHVVTDAALLHLKPEVFNFSVAAALPTVFLTAYYGLHFLAKVQPGDKVLIHAGTGGVGLAAIQVAQWLGAEIYTTVGSELKRNYLKKLGIKHIYNSRTLEYAKQILQDTQGRGVDVVLNSLSAMGFIENTVSCCAPQARFLEIGKRNIWSVEQMQQRRPDIEYHVIALDDLLTKDPQKIQGMLQEVSALFAKRDFIPIAHTTYPITEAKSAFSFMQRAKQIGKVVITIPQKNFTLDPNACYWITGGLGGLGLKLSEWLVENGAKNLVLSSRHSPNAQAMQTIEALSQRGVMVETIAIDVADLKQVVLLLQRFGKDLPYLKGIVHAAGILDDAIIFTQTWAHFAKVFAPKVYGTWNIYQALQQNSQPLEFFVLYSSVASAFGSKGQSNYAAANTFMDAFASFARSKGIAATAINWGPWAEVGMAANIASQAPFNKEYSLLALVPGMQALLQAISCHTSQLVIADFKKTEVIASSQENIATTSEDLLDKLSGENLLETEKLLREYLQNLLREVLGLGVQVVGQDDRGFFEMGMDSLLAIETRNKLQAALGNKFTLSSTVFFDYPTINKLLNYLLTEVFGLTKKEIDMQVVSDSSEEFDREMIRSMSSKEIDSFLDGFLKDE